MAVASPRRFSSLFLSELRGSPRRSVLGSFVWDRHPVFRRVALSHNGYFCADDSCGLSRSSAAFGVKDAHYSLCEQHA